MAKMLGCLKKTAALVMTIALIMMELVLPMAALAGDLTALPILTISYTDALCGNHHLTGRGHLCVADGQAVEFRHNLSVTGSKADIETFTRGGPGGIANVSTSHCSESGV